MKVFWCPNTRSVRILWMLEETGVAYERSRIDIRDPQSKSDPQFLAASPMGKVPALIDGAVKIWDSGAICAYLADQYPAQRLAPPVSTPSPIVFESAYAMNDVCAASLYGTAAPT